MDVASFLNVKFENSLFFFDGRFRPVPLEQTWVFYYYFLFIFYRFIGVKCGPQSQVTGKEGGTTPMELLKQMDIVCYERMAQFVRDGHQVCV
jgi:hypothetical protein